MIHAKGVSIFVRKRRVLKFESVGDVFFCFVFCTSRESCKYYHNREKRWNFIFGFLLVTMVVFTISWLMVTYLIMCGNMGNFDFCMILIYGIVDVFFGEEGRNDET